MCEKLLFQSRQLAARKARQRELGAAMIEYAILLLMVVAGTIALQSQGSQFGSPFVRAYCALGGGSASTLNGTDLTTEEGFVCPSTVPPPID